MASVSSLRSWLPDRTPNWIDVVVALIAIFWLATEMDGRTLSWPWVVVGFLALVLAVGPVASSSIGDVVGERAQSLGGVGVLLVILALAAILLFAASVFQIPEYVTHSFVTGLMAAIPILTAVHVLVSGQIGDWQFAGGRE